MAMLSGDTGLSFQGRHLAPICLHACTGKIKETFEKLTEECEATRRMGRRVTTSLLLGCPKERSYAAQNCICALHKQLFMQ